MAAESSPTEPARSGPTKVHCALALAKKNTNYSTLYLYKKIQKVRTSTVQVSSSPRQNTVRSTIRTTVLYLLVVGRVKQGRNTLRCNCNDIQERFSRIQG
jgi:hypothetical protein